MSRSLGLALMVFGIACGPSHHPVPVPQPKGVVSLADGLATTSIAGVDHFKSMAYQDGGLLLPGRTLKFLIDLRVRATPGVYFMNSNFLEDGERPDAAKYHFNLAERVLEDFDMKIEDFRKITYDVQDKTFVAGSIQTFFVDGDPEPLYGIQLFPQDVAKDQTVVDLVGHVVPRLALPGVRLAFVATGEQQTVNDAAAAGLEKLGVLNQTLDDVLGSIDFIPLNRGTAYGFLRMFPDDPDILSPTDIPVFDELPIDLTVVAGTVTRAYQDPTSHVNLKSKERGTPNMVLRSAGPTHAELSRWVDKPVKLSVEVDGFTIEPSNASEVKARLDERRNKPWVTLPFEPSSDLPTYASMCPDDPAACLPLTATYGAKATMLGFMSSPKVLGRKGDAGSLSAKYGYDIVPAGIGVPFSMYRAFVDHPPNSELRNLLQRLIADEIAGRLSPKEVKTRSAAVRAAFYAAAFPPGMVGRIRARIERVLGRVKKVKVRSSANAEDMPQFDGAGLYNSFSAKPFKKENPDKPCAVVVDGVKLKAKPKTLSCAIKGVYASLWNKRAIDERSFARLDHRTALMGIAIVPAYDLESEVAANSVVITRVVATENVYGYTLANQRDNVLVTNPLEGTLAENVVAAFNEPEDLPSFAVTRHAVPVAGRPAMKETVYTDAGMRRLVEITRTAEIAYCQARSDYYRFDCRYAPADPRKPRALDFELKFLANGRFVCKQMREFSGR